MLSFIRIPKPLTNFRNSASRSQMSEDRCQATEGMAQRAVIGYLLSVIRVP
ncbi:hypothetical protein D1AOALGA4SA_863 [Olavius algarvensis Delta 1 endosymbiont]|nr:hypothetical protein D1AOALGA4SA_863 [Olavius algarvensis Delta 1 endosymbiont]